MDGIPMSIESLATNTTILPQNTTHGEHSKSNGFATAFKLNDRFLTRFTFSTLEYTSSRFPFLSIIHSSPRSHMSANTAGMLRAISTERFLRVSKPRFWQRIPCSIYSSLLFTNQTGSDKKEATKDVLGLRLSIKGYGLIVIQSFSWVGFDETEIQYWSM